MSNRRYLKVDKGIAYSSREKDEFSIDLMFLSYGMLP